MLTVLALDVSSVSTGFAIGRIGDRPLSGQHRFAPKGSSDDAIWFAAMKWATGMVNEHKPDVVAIEAPIMASSIDDATGRPQTNPKTHGQLLGLQAVIRTVVLAKLGSPAKLIFPSSARKLFTGRGTFPKDEAKPAVRRMAVELGWVTPEEATEDRADALCIWAKACADLDREFAASFTPLALAAQRQPQDVRF